MTDILIEAREQFVVKLLHPSAHVEASADTDVVMSSVAKDNGGIAIVISEYSMEHEIGATHYIAPKPMRIEAERGMFSIHRAA